MNTGEDGPDIATDSNVVAANGSSVRCINILSKPTLA